PITDDSLRLNHYQGGFDTVAHYLHLYPDSRIFAGKGFILGGSFANEINPPKGVKVGDLSANLIDDINPLANMVRIPDKTIALLSDWNKKLPALVAAAVKADITNISGVPSWFLTVLKESLKATGANTIHDIWPNLEVFFHGGISMEPYWQQYAHITAPRMRYLETYNASEGFFGVQTSIGDRSLSLLTDAGVFYEFIPVDDSDATPLAAWEVEEGQTYALIITSVNGLTRYAIGDTVKITSKCPLQFIIAGRTKHYINAFGEELMVHNAEEAMARTCADLHCHVANYTAAPVYAGDNTRGCHQWLIEFSGEIPDIDRFADVLDRHLCEINSDYQAKRQGSIFLDRPLITVAPAGLFFNWLAATGKVGGQRKVPRLCPDRRFIDPMIAMIQTAR
ncbi:MAG: GH3 auxin-responsive promoter family protein, partial [Muribaculum sp.]|nr:GH3 auxin-responsive promoter family protein [Muribaculum sp.]